MSLVLGLVIDGRRTGAADLDAGARFARRARRRGAAPPARAKISDRPPARRAPNRRHFVASARRWMRSASVQLLRRARSPPACAGSSARRCPGRWADTRRRRSRDRARRSASHIRRAGARNPRSVCSPPRAFRRCDELGGDGAFVKSRAPVARDAAQRLRPAPDCCSRSPSRRMRPCGAKTARRARIAQHLVLEHARNRKRRAA